jgi:outer membrane protein assembly factor BamA
MAVALLLGAASVPAPAAEPAVCEIVFAGNDTTRPQVMRREVLLQPGDPASAGAIERGRQAIMDLGLFREVTAEQEALDCGVRVTYRVREKWYLLPYPRVGAKADGQNNVGAELRWSNLWGLNHTLRLLYSSDNRKEPGRDRVSRYLGSYTAPFIFDSRYSLSLSGAHAVTPVTDPAPYDEVTSDAEALLSRGLSTGRPASQGWSLGGGLAWHEQDTRGAGAPPPEGWVMAVVGQLRYDNLRYRLYSESGTKLVLRYENANRMFDSDYNYKRLQADVRRIVPIGSIAHQDLVFGLRLGSTNGGPPGSLDYGIGGVDSLRGYAKDFRRGDFYYVASVEYLRPLHWDWLRAGVILENGNAYESWERLNDESYSSLGLGLRVRLPRLVNFEFEAGFAWPLVAGPQARFYGDRVEDTGRY